MIVRDLTVRFCAKSMLYEYGPRDKITEACTVQLHSPVWSVADELNLSLRAIDA